MHLIHFLLLLPQLIQEYSGYEFTLPTIKLTGQPFVLDILLTDAAYEAGLPVLEQANHSIYLPNYTLGCGVTVSWCLRASNR